MTRFLQRDGQVPLATATCLSSKSSRLSALRWPPLALGNNISVFFVLAVLSAMLSARRQSSWSAVCIALSALFPCNAHGLLCQESRQCVADQSTRISASRFAQRSTTRRGRGVRTTLFDREPPATRRFQGARGSGPKDVYGAYSGWPARVGFERNEMVLRKQRSGRKTGSPSTGDFGFGP